MIDNGKYTTQYRTAEEVRSILSSPKVSFLQTFRNRSGFDVQQYSFRNLVISVGHDPCQISIRGSLAKFINGNNYEEVSFGQTVSAYLELCRVLNKNPSDILVHALECSIVVRTPVKPFEYLDCVLSHKQRRFYYEEPPKSFTRPLLIYCPAQQYRIKFYDTGQWHGQPNANLLKYEISFHKATKILAVLGQGKRHASLSVNDLIDFPNFQRFGNYMLQVYKEIDIAAKPKLDNYKKLSRWERLLLYAGASIEFWESERAVYPQAAKDERATYLKLKKELPSESVKMKDLERRIAQQIGSAFNLPPI